jgi:probable HAF family extracellular repeat protein
VKRTNLLDVMVSVFSAAMILPACQSQVAPTTSGTVPKSQHHHYRVVDVGTFGGPNGDVLVPPPAAQILTNSGIFVGAGETKISDPFAPNCFRTPECVVEEGLLRFAGTSIDIGSLKHGYSGIPLAVNDFGIAVGFSQNGEIDPLTGSYELKAALWYGGSVIDLGTLGGNGASANAINDRGQIFGGALNTIPDAYPSFPFFVPGATQVHAVLWEHGAIKDLGTLGGTDSVVYQANDSGQAMGISFTDNTVHDSTGLPTTHPFIWNRGKMHDVGSLGGTYSEGYGFNNRAEVVGFSNLAGDTNEHPFVWKRGLLTDLGTLGGDNGEAWAINNDGHIAGWADLPGSQTHHAFLHRDRQMIDLGTPHGNACSKGETINTFDQVVGDSGECGVGGDPFLWEKGDMVALSDLILPGSDRILFDAFQINDRGEIVSLCSTPEGDVHVCLLMPVQHDKSAAVQSNPATQQTRALPSKLPPTGERRIMTPTAREIGNSSVRTLPR